MPDTENNANAFSIHDEPDIHGGVVRHVTGADISYDTVTEGSLAEGVTAHNAQGEPITGTGFVPRVTETVDIEAEIEGFADMEGELEAPGIEYRTYNIPPATRGTLGGIIVGQDLLVTEEGVLSVDKATSAEEDNTRPITAAAVYTEIGNINALLGTI